MISARELLASATTALAAAGVASARADAEWLLAHVLGVSRGALTFASVSAAERTRFTQLVTRRVAREPLQHIVGTAAFRHVEVRVGPGVFTPRLETEVMVGWAVAVGLRLGTPRVVDLCTGSGAIALAVATELPLASVHAVELSEQALAYATDNLDGSGVELRHGDIATAFGDLDGRCDIVVANPPYIPLAAWETVDAEARTYDPALSLWSGQDGLDAIRVVEAVAGRLLRPGGVLACEHADVQGDSVPELFSATSRWANIRDNTDLSGRPRFVTACRA